MASLGSLLTGFLPPLLLSWLEGVIYAFPIFFLGIGLWQGSVAVLGALRRRRFLQRAVRTTGRVLRMEQVAAGKRSVRYRPVLTFQRRDGQVETFVTTLTLDKPFYDVGQELPVCYDPENPAEAYIGKFWHLWLWPLFNGFMSLFLLFLCGYLWLALRSSL
jgi:hypothetical protein